MQTFKIRRFRDRDLSLTFNQTVKIQKSEAFWISPLYSKFQSLIRSSERILEKPKWNLAQQFSLLPWLRPISRGPPATKMATLKYAPRVANQNSYGEPLEEKCMDLTLGFIKFLEQKNWIRLKPKHRTEMLLISMRKLVQLKLWQLYIKLLGTVHAIFMAIFHGKSGQMAMNLRHRPELPSPNRPFRRRLMFERILKYFQQKSITERLHIWLLQ